MVSLSDLSRKFNWRQIITHLFATLFFVLAAKQFACLNDLEFVSYMNDHGVHELCKQYSADDDFEIRLGRFTNSILISPFIGMFVSFLLSLFLTLKNNQSWMNALVVLIAAIVSNYFGVFDHKTTQVLFFSFGELFVRFGLIYKFIVNGTLLLLIGLSIFSHTPRSRERLVRSSENP